MAEINSVPLGQSGTGSAFVLGENKALDRFLKTQDYNTQVDRQNALATQKQKQADDLRRQKAFAEGQLNLEAGILFPDVDQRVQQFGDKYKNYYIEGGDPNILPDELSRERVLAESASQRRKQLQPVLLDMGKQIRTSPNKYTGRSIEEYNNYLQLPFEEALAKGLPALEERFNENTFLDKIKVGTTKTEGLVNGRIVQQTTTDPNTVRKSVITGLKGDPAFEAKMQEELGIPANITLGDIESLPSNVEGIIADTDNRWSGDPTFRQELATQYGITSKDDPKYTAFKNQEALKMFQYKRSVDELLNDYTQKVIAKNPSAYSNLPDYTGMREARLREGESDASNSVGEPTTQTFEGTTNTGTNTTGGANKNKSVMVSDKFVTYDGGVVSLPQIDGVYNVKTGKTERIKSLDAAKITGLGYFPYGGGKQGLMMSVVQDDKEYLIPENKISQDIKNSKKYKAVAGKLGTAPQTQSGSQPTSKQNTQSKSTGKKAVSGYKIGQVDGGYKYMGGDPSKQENWVKQ